MSKRVMRPGWAVLSKNSSYLLPASSSSVWRRIVEEDGEFSAHWPFRGESTFEKFDTEVQAQEAAEKAILAEKKREAAAAAAVVAELEELFGDSKP